MSSAPPERASISPPAVFVGRERELSRLETALGKVRVAVVCGVAGIGKSTLATAFAARSGRPVVRRRADSEPVGTLIDDVRRSLAGGAVAELGDDDERIADLATRLDDARAIWLLEDLHRMPVSARHALMGGLSRALSAGLVLATSRERLVDAAHYDHALLVLEGLDEPNALALWHALDELYGSAGGAPAALQRARGNPFLVRRAHAGGLDDDDPIAGTLAALSEDERRLATALALVTPRLPVALLGELLPRERAVAALRRLVALLVVEVDGASRCALHDLFHDQVLAAASPSQRSELSATLAALLQRDAELDPVVMVREVARHLGAAGRHHDAAAHLVEHGADMVRRGATAELLRQLEALPESARGPATALARARCIARLLDLPRAHAEIAKLVEAGAEPRKAIAMAHAELAFSLGQVATGVAAARAIVDDAGTAPELRAPALDQLCLMRTHLGEGAGAREELRDAELAERDDLRAAAHAFARAFSAWVDEDRDALDQALRQAQGMLPHAGQAYAAKVLVPAAMAAMCARLGRHEEAEAQLASAADDRHEDPYSQVYMRRMRGAVLYERDDRLGAMAELSAASRAYAAAGAVLSAWSSDVWLARVCFLLGKRNEALQILERTRSHARAAGAFGVVRAVERALAFDPLQMLEQPGVAVVERSGSLRARTIEALRVAARGEGDAARRAIAALTPEVGLGGEGASCGFGLDQALVLLAQATLARIDGKSSEAEALLGSAARAAEQDGVDPDLVAEVDRRLGHVRVITTDRRRTAAAPDLSEYSVVLDGGHHQLRGPNGVLSLANRPAVRRLLYALASQPNAVVSKEALAGALWQARYKPSTHDGALWVNVRRLRVLLERTGLSVELREDGYSLQVPEGFVFIDSPDES